MLSRALRRMPATPLTFSFVDSVAVDATSITVPPTAAANDVAVLLDRACMGTFTIPTSVVPGDFSPISDQAGVSVIRAIASYKILVGGDVSAAKTGMNGTASTDGDLKIMLIFRPSRPITSVTFSTPNSQATAGNPTLQTVTAGAAPQVVIAHYCASSISAVSSPSFSPAEDGSVTNDATRQIAKYKIYNTAPVNVDVDEADGGDDNILQSFTLTAT